MHWSTWVSLIFGFGSLLFAIITLVTGKKKKRFSFERKTNIIVASKKSRIDKLSLQYDGEEIENLSSTIFYIWNSGNSVINDSDIVSERPLSIICSGTASFLDAQIIRASEETNAFTIEPKGKQKADISFNYVEPGDGVAVQILHTGPAKDITLDCKIKGGKEILNNSEKKKTRSTSFFFFFETYLLAICFLLAFIHLEEKHGYFDNMSISIQLLLIIVLTICAVTVSYLLIRAIDRTLHSKIPKSLTE